MGIAPASMEQYAKDAEVAAEVQPEAAEETAEVTTEEVK